jgi:AraC-like DNA-binding protein
MIAACLQTNRETVAAAQPVIAGAVLNEIQKFIERNLHRPDLTPELLSRQFRVSRAQLYRLFEPLNGISRYILKRRLAAAYERLARGEKTRIGILAHQLGFSSEAHFSRVFHQAYGESPREIKRMALLTESITAPSPVANSQTPAFVQWIRNLSNHTTP